ncbi:hypothetical protein D3C72_1800560 [compost metagenome]
MNAVPAPSRIAWALAWAKFHTRRRKRDAPSTPEPLHSSCCSGGAANITNRRAVSAPYWSISACGSMPLFFDFDIFSTPPITTGWPSAFSVAPSGRPRSSVCTSTSAGLYQCFLPEASSR